MNTIGRANLDGTGVNQSFITGVSNAVGIAVDGTYVYWTQTAGGTSTIGRANLDGTGVNQNFITVAGGPYGLAVDARSTRGSRPALARRRRSSAAAGPTS